MTIPHRLRTHGQQPPVVLRFGRAFFRCRPRGGPRLFSVRIDVGLRTLSRAKHPMNLPPDNNIDVKHLQTHSTNIRVHRELSHVLYPT